MKKTIQFSKTFKPMLTIYLAFLVLGFIFLFTKGLNRGIDFQSGFVAQVKFAPTVLSLSYEGNDSVAFSQDDAGIYIVTTSINAESSTKSFLYSEYKTVGDFIAGCDKIQGLKAVSNGNDTIALDSLFSNSAEGTRLTAKPTHLHSLQAADGILNSDDIRQALASVSGLAVQQLGSTEERTFQFRLADNDPEKNAGVALNATLDNALAATYGAENYAYLSTDFMGSQFSASLVLQSILLVVCSIILIFIYVMIRFKWNFALSAVIALVLDTFTMLVYMSLTQIEFSTFTVAALLTIIGYSVNDTVVMFDRMRENTRLFPDMLGTEIFDKSITEVLSRSIITTITTMTAVVILFLFTEGSIQDFANVLLIGLTSGIITTLFLSTAILNLTCGGKKGQAIIRSSVAER